MNFEEIYKENLNRKSREIEYISSNFVLRTKLENLLNNKILLVISLLLILFIIISLPTRESVLCAILLFIIIFLFSIFFNTYSVIVEDNDIKIKTSGEEILIPKNNIKNVYLEEKTYRILFKKRKNYLLVILYETPNNNISDIVLTTLLLSSNDLKEWFNTIKIKKEKVNNQEKCIKYKRKRLFKKIILYLMLILLAFIVHFIFY